MRGGVSGDKPHVGIAGVALHKTRHISIIEDTDGCEWGVEGVLRVCEPVVFGGVRGVSKREVIEC